MSMYRARRGVLAGSLALALFAPFVMVQSAAPFDEHQDASQGSNQHCRFVCRQ